MFRRADIHLEIMHIDWNRKFREVRLHEWTHIAPVQPAVATPKARERDFGYSPSLEFGREFPEAHFDPFEP